MQLDELKQTWSSYSSRDDAARLTRVDVLRMIEARMESIRSQIKQRLRAEITYYLLPAVATAVALAMKWGIEKLIFWTPVALGVGVVVATLSYGSRKLEQVDVTTDIRSAVAQLIRNYDFVLKLYMAEYMLLIVLGVAAGISVWISTRGLGSTTFIFIAAGLGVVLWAYRAGRAYLEVHFMSYQQELARCLTELEC